MTTIVFPRLIAPNNNVQRNRNWWQNFFGPAKTEGNIESLLRQGSPSKAHKEKKSSTDIQIMHEKLRKVRISASLHESEIHGN